VRASGKVLLSLLTGALLLTAVWGFVWLRVSIGRVETEHEFENLTASIAVEIDERVSGIVRGLDRALLLLRQDWRAGRTDTMGRVEELVAAASGDLVREIAIADAQGSIVYTSRDKQPANADVGDRDFFRSHASGIDRLVIGHRVTGYLAAGPSLVLSRPLLNASGALQGAILMWIDPDRLLSGVRRLPPDVGGGRYLAGEDGVVRACKASDPGDTGPCEETFEPAELPVVAPGMTAAFRIPGKDGQPARIGHLRSIQQFPLSVIVVWEDSALTARALWRQPVPLIAPALVTSALIVLGLVAFGFVLAARDRRIAKLSLREARWRSALEALSDGVWEWHRATDRTHLSENARVLLGRASPVIENAWPDWLARIHPDDLKRVRTGLEDVATGNSDIYRCEHRVRRDDGVYVWVLAMGFTLSRTAEGRVEETVGIMMDLSERRALEATLQQKTDELAKANAKIAELALTDALSGLLNRRGFVERAEQALARLAAEGRPAAILAVDIDGLRRINDAFGYEAGDTALRTLARRLQRQTGRDGVIGRIGGGTFAALLPDTGRAAGVSQAQSIQAAVAGQAVRLTDGREIRATVTIGVTALEDGIADFTAVFERAEEALRLAKTQGRNQTAALRFQVAVPPVSPAPR
jgi:diguanylate cyclase (GGDEF)-like protein/PAS domain S-box-containing protein